MPIHIHNAHTHTHMCVCVCVCVSLTDATYSQYAFNVGGRNLLYKIDMQLPEHKASYSRKRIFKESFT